MWVMHSCCRGKGLILISAVLMGSCVLIHLVKLSHELPATLGISVGSLVLLSALVLSCPPSGCETCC